MSKNKIIKIELNLGHLPGPSRLITPFKKLWSNHRPLVLLFILVVQILIVGGREGILAYQTDRYIKEGDKHFSWERYQEALTSFQKADSAWQRTLFLELLRESPTAWRVGKASDEVERLARSHENYLKGVEKFEDKKWKDAVKLFSKVETDDPDYSDAQKKIKNANREIAAAKKKSEEGEVAGASTRVVYRTITKPAPPPPPDAQTQQKVSDLEKKVTELENQPQAPPQEDKPFSLSLSQSEISAVVGLWCLDTNNYELLPYRGSGTIYDPNGFIFTNKHVVQQQDGSVSFTVCAVGITSDISQPPDWKYIAALYAYSSSTDVADLIIVDAFEGYTLPASFPYLTTGSSSVLTAGDYVAIIGYPDYGGLTWTLTEGIVSGFVGDDIKTDAQISNGNSGGAALNKAKEFIGIPTYGIPGGGGSLGYIIRIDTVLALTDWVTLY